ncbi:hypothetical protein [Vibrio gallaecicus]|nr:hypothetical protein [Vibrio gallaecicus]MDN3616694.1 hypothetical protein [Vibrio gallaecicus]
MKIITLLETHRLHIYDNKKQIELIILKLDPSKQGVYIVAA